MLKLETFHFLPKDMAILPFLLDIMMLYELKLVKQKGKTGGV
jgi:hypothetical protein